MASVIEQTEGYYDVQDVEFGRVYRWCPGWAVVRCDCGRWLTLTSSTATCRCGADHTAFVREELASVRLRDEALRPWRYAAERTDGGLSY
jgi:hypothetical protein